MRGEKNPIYRLVPFLLVGYLLIYQLQTHIDRHRRDYVSTEEILYIRSSRLLKKMSLGYESLLADIYWLRTVQYYGGKQKDVEQQPYDLLESLLDLTVFLDPEMVDVYRFGATFLSEPQPVGLGEPLKGIRLLDEGLKNNPSVWRFYFDKGFIYLWHLKDHRRAAETFLEGSRHPSAPRWMETLAAYASSQGAELETARYLWKKQYDEAENDELRSNALNHLNSLKVEEDLCALELLIEKYKKRTGRRIQHLQQLVAAGLLNSLPRDPSGLPYVFYRDSQTVGLAKESKVTYYPWSLESRKEYLKRLQSQGGT